MISVVIVMYNEQTCDSNPGSGVSIAIPRHTLAPT